MSSFLNAARSRVGTTLLSGVMLGLTACAASDKAPVAPVIPGEPSFPAAFRQSQVVFDVSVRSKKVIVSIAGNSVNGGNNVTGKAGSSVTLEGANPSLLGKDVIQISTSNYNAGGLGQNGAPAGKVRIRFDVAITNLLNGVIMETPTFPTPPAGQTGVFMFPFLTTVTNTAGGTSVEDGNTVVIETPGYGVVTPSVDFDGAAHNFFNDNACPAGQVGGEGGGNTGGGPNPPGTTGQTSQTDCFRYENYPSINGGSTSAPRTVGFDIDPTVQQFRVRMLVAADLRNAVTPTGSIQGVVSSSVIGPIVGAIVSAGGVVDTTIAGGQYTLPGVTIGNQTVSVIGYTPSTPNGCGVASASLIVSTGVNTQNLAIAGCIAPPIPAGTVNGSLSTTGASTSLAGVGVILTVDAPSTYMDTVTVSGTTFSFPGVPVNQATAGRVTGFTNVPANCTPTTAPAAGVNTYSGLTDGGTVSIAAINFTCSIAYPAVYSYSTGGALADTIQLTVGFNMGASDLNPANNGTAQDRLTGMTYRLVYNNTALEAVEATGGAGFSTFSPNVAFAPNTVSIIGATSGSGNASNQGTNVILTRIKFVRRAGFTGSLTGLTSTATVVNAAGPGVGAITPASFISLTPPVTP
jgi:hypothetical protein